MEVSQALHPHRSRAEVNRFVQEPVLAHDLTPAATLAGNTTMGAALSDFERRYPAYAGTAVLDGMRARDYTGWTQPATSISTTPAGACTPTASWPATGTCWPAPCSATRTPRTCPRAT